MMNDATKIAILAATLREAYQLINDHTLLYASEFCDSDDVEEARARLRSSGGTLSRNAHVLDHIREALEMVDIQP